MSVKGLGVFYPTNKEENQMIHFKPVAFWPTIDLDDDRKMIQSETRSDILVQEIRHLERQLELKRKALVKVPTKESERYLDI